MTKIQPKVGILMGSDSDLEVMREAEKRLDSFAVAYETRILASCRRTAHLKKPPSMRPPHSNAAWK